MKKLKKLKSLKTLKNKADAVFSKYIRERDNHKCYTCGKQLTPQTSQCGHFISRNHLYYRYSEVNCHTQGSECNIFKSGNLAVYATNLANQYGVYILNEFQRDKNKSVGNTREFLMGIIEKYGNRADN
jgi:hypothetical protein